MTDRKNEDSPKQRQHWMSVLARADEDALEAAIKTLPVPGFRFLRKPEIGLAMVRGRAGGNGSAFNLGEVTVTRCVIETEEGYRGFGYVRGRSKRHAELAAIGDAVLQKTPELIEALVDPLYQDWVDIRNAVSRKAASTRVDFMTMVRGE